jgi:hypothetical protein
MVRGCKLGIAGAGGRQSNRFRPRLPATKHRARPAQWGINESVSDIVNVPDMLNAAAPT